ncbi:MAG: EscU/YscU/HrcU family type III secretion system export apparatus switch protein [bacterium]|nr:EscU/YscU/HrcU family type III secretion system export apparatus switch protein [bacterium]
MNQKRVDLRRHLSQRPAAAALHYDPLSTAPPEVVAVGRGRMAEEILQAARENGVPLYEDAALVEALARLDIGEGIPRELFAIVAEVLVFVYRTDAGSSP